MKRFSVLPALAAATLLYAAMVTACNDSIEANKAGGKSSGVTVLELTEANFEAKTASGIVLVDFWAEWCGPCRMIAPIIKELAGDYDGRATIAKVDIDANPGLAQKFKVTSIPNLKILKDGQVVENIVGVVPKEQITKKLDAHL